MHFVGIGGAGMSGLARLLLAAGEPVSGSDLKESDTTRALAAAGARIHIGHRPENLGDAEAVVYTAAAREDNPELVEARRRGLPCVIRAEMLGRVMAGKRGVAIAGTHGKTTTTGMAAAAFLAAGADPTVLVGGDWSALGGNARAGVGVHFLAEACEAFNSFLELHPTVAVLTNVEADHLDCHGSLEGIIAAFARFLSQVDPAGYVVGCADDPHVRGLLAASGRRPVTYALEGPADYTGVDLDLASRRPSFTLAARGEAVGRVTLGVPGRHNVSNALAVLALGLEEGLSFPRLAEGLAGFTGVDRRFDVLGEPGGVLVVDDYAHHPTEIRATLAAARASLGRPLTAVFQPHLYSRTQLLLDDFARAFADADKVIVAEVYGAREAPIPGVTGGLLAERINELNPGKEAQYAPDRAALPALLAAGARPGDAVLTLGAGDIREVGEELVALLGGA
jgi:UDP-N-acetylmuramate--alanine ligase